VADATKLPSKAGSTDPLKQIDETDSTYDKETLPERLASSPVVCVGEGGAATETEMKDKKLRLEMPINAHKAAC